jgi:hypothetical protein
MQHPEKTTEARSVSRRALIKLGWVVPVVMAVGIPRDAFANYRPPLDDNPI